MKSSRTQRWDLVVGALASLVSVAGFLLSIALGNTAAMTYGYVHPETQKFLAVLAVMFLVLVLIKAGLRYRKACRLVCNWSIKQLFSRPRSRG